MKANIAKKKKKHVPYLRCYFKNSKFLFPKIVFNEAPFSPVKCELSWRQQEHMISICSRCEREKGKKVKGIIAQSYVLILIRLKALIWRKHMKETADRATADRDATSAFRYTLKYSWIWNVFLMCRGWRTCSASISCLAQVTSIYISIFEFFSTF